MIRIRLQKVGRAHQPFYRIVAADSRVKQTGRVREVLGTYNPHESDKAAEVKLDRERVQYWLGCGAQVSETMTSILKAHDLLPERLKGTPGAKK